MLVVKIIKYRRVQIRDGLDVEDYYVSLWAWIRILWFKGLGYIWRTARFLKREWKDAKIFIFTSLFTLVCCVLLVMAGISMEKYANWIDGFWDLKSTLLTTVVLGGFLQLITDSRNWNRKILMQWNFSTNFSWESRDLLVNIASGGRSSYKMVDGTELEYLTIDELKKIILNSDEHIDMTFSDSLQTNLKSYLKFLDGFIDDLSKAEIAVEQTWILENLRQIRRDLARMLTFFDGSVDDEALSLSSEMQSVVDQIAYVSRLLTSPWAWDKKSTKKLKDMVLKSNPMLIQY